MEPVELKIVKLQEASQTERLAMQIDHELLKELLEADIQTKLLIVALGSTALDAILLAYQEWKKGQTSASSPEEKKKISLLAYITGLAEQTATSGLKMGIFGAAGMGIGQMFDLTRLNNGAIPDGPYGAVNALATCATTTAGLAWAALFASIILGEGGLGGVLDKVGGGAGGLGAIAGAVV